MTVEYKKLCHGLVAELFLYSFREGSVLYWQKEGRAPDV